MPRPAYRFAILTTRRRFDSASFFFASSSPSSIFFASSISSSGESSGTFPISFKYIRTGSSTPIPSGTDRSICSTSISSSGSASSSSENRSGSISSSFDIFKTSTCFLSRKSYMRSSFSGVSSSPAKASRTSVSSRTFFLLFASSRSFDNFSSNVSVFSSIIPSFPAPDVPRVCLFASASLSQV